jgi:long-chain acyl-CoA synthetase
MATWAATSVTATDSVTAQRRVAGALRERAINAGDRVVLALPGSADYASVVLGATRSGVIPVPLDPRLTPYEFTHVLEQVEPSLVLREPDQLAELLDGPEAEIDEWPRCRPMHFTSGTTGSPKGVWSGMLTPDDAGRLAGEERDAWGFDADERHLVISPIYHSAPLRFASSTILAGGVIAVLPKFDPETFADALREWHPTSLFCVPAQLQRLFEWQDTTDQGLETGSLRLVAHAGAPCPDRIRRRAHQTFGTDVVWEFYGSTEGQWTACPASSWIDHPGTVGQARPGRVITADEDGVLWCAVPPWATFEYWADADKTASAWKETPDGRAFTVGDLGRVEDGWVYLDGRRTDLIITGGVNVYPAEVESALSEAPGLTDIAVFGRSDERWGQRVCAAVVGDVEEHVLRALATARLAPPKRPKEYVRLDALPRTATGKVRRHELR